jgi:hypothetical protein
MAPLPAPASEKPLTRLRMRPTNETNNKKRPTKTQKQETKTRSKPTKNEAKTKVKRSKKDGPRKQAKEELKQQQPNRRHTTNPFDSCLGRSLMIPNVRKARA